MKMVILKPASYFLNGTKSMFFICKRPKSTFLYSKLLGSFCNHFKMIVLDQEMNFVKIPSKKHIFLVDNIFKKS